MTLLHGATATGTDTPGDEWVARDLASVWHPFTQHAVWAGDDPLVVTAAEGPWLVGADGRRYLDGTSSLWVSVHGHREPALDAAVRAQLDRVAHSTFLGLTHEPGIRLAEDLLATAPRGDGPDLTKVFYAGDGSSAVEAALKMAYQAAAQRGESRPLFVSFAEGYHGDTLGAVSVGGVALFHATYGPVLLETRRVSSPGVLAPGQDRAARAAEVLDELATLLDREGDRVCAVVAEPLVQAAGGMLTHDPAFLRGLRALCDRSGALLVVDEVATGVGRTGRMWAIEAAGVVPDLLVCGKGVTGGYLPLSAVLAAEHVYAAFLGTPDSGRTFFHGHTYTANPLACAAALANLELMRERQTVAAAARLGDRVGARLDAALAGLDGVVEVRRAGTMVGVEVESRGPRTGFEVCRRAREEGVWVRPLGDVVVLMPPLALADAEADLLVDVVAASVRSVLCQG